MEIKEERIDEIIKIIKEFLLSRPNSKLKLMDKEIEYKALAEALDLMNKEERRVFVEELFEAIMKKWRER
jgi:NADP-dependent 3-hydroxy acid dehydrogenase YdfG